MKIIFLDIDGVLNSDFEEQTARHEISNRCIDLLNKLIEKTGAKIVVTSVWRIHFSISNLQEHLCNHGFKGEIIDFTPVLGEDCVRGNEINKWIKDNVKDKLESYIILDDDSDMLLGQGNNYIWVDNYIGLTENIIRKAAYILNKGT